MAQLGELTEDQQRRWQRTAIFHTRHEDGRQVPLVFEQNEHIPPFSYATARSNIDRQKTLLEKIDYCHKNPITRGLVDRAGDWPWSSYRYYQLDDSSVLKMGWDGVWPIVW